MNKLIRLLSIGAIAAILATSFAGCGKENNTGNNSQASAGNTAGSVEPVKLTFWGGIPEESGPKNAVDAWNQKNPNIQVEYIRYVNDESGNTKLDAAILSGNSVDLFTSHGADNATGRITAGMAAPLDEYLKKENMDIQKLFGAGYYNYNNEVYGVPDTNPADFIWLNKSMFDKAGIPIPTEWTYDEFRAIAQKLTTGSGDSKVYGTMMYPGWSDNWMRTAYTVLGPDNYSEKMSFNLDSDYFKKALQLRYDMEMTDKSWVPIVNITAEKLTIQDMYFKGKVAMVWAGSFPLRYLKDDKNYPHDFVTAFAPVPKWDKGQEKYYNSAGAIDGVVSISKSTANKDQAWAFMKWWLTEGFETYCVPFGKIPSYLNADKTKMEASLLNNDYTRQRIDVDSFKRVFLGDTAATGEFFTTPLSEARKEVATMMNREVEKCLTGVQSVDQTMDSMKQQANEITKRRNK